MIDREIDDRVIAVTILTKLLHSGSPKEASTKGDGILGFEQVLRVKPTGTVGDSSSTEERKPNAAQGPQARLRGEPREPASA